MWWYIGFFALMALGTFVFIKYLSRASVLRRRFRRYPETSVMGLREGVPARVTGTIAALDTPLTAPIGAAPCVRVHVELLAYVPGAKMREDYIYQAGTPALIRDPQGGVARLDFGLRGLSVRFVDEPLTEQPLDLGAPAVAKLFHEFGISESFRTRRIIPMGRQATVPVGVEVSILALPRRAPDGEWELTPLHGALMVRVHRRKG